MTRVKLKEQYISYLPLLQTLNNISVIMLLRTFNIISPILDVRRGDYVIHTHIYSAEIEFAFKHIMLGCNKFVNSTNFTKFHT